MSQAHIYLTPTEDNPLGVIGEVEGENGEPIKGIMLADVVAQVAQYPYEKNFLFHCAGPGGAVDVGDQIYDYMENLKREGKQVDTITDDHIGSIMTKVFMAGQNRTIVDGHNFYIHAPWVPHMEGNATHIAGQLEGLINEEIKLHRFYQQKTGINDSGMSGLMAGSNGNDGTFITADQAVKMKFATRLLPSKIKAFALVKTKNMSTQAKTPGQYLDQLLGLAPKALDPIPAAPAAAAPAPTPAAPQALLTLESDKGTLTSDATDPGKLEQSNITVIDATGASMPAPDDTFTLDDGRIITTVGGKVATVTMPAAAQAPTPEPVPNAQELKIKALEDELTAMKAQPPVAEQIAAAIEGFKNSLVSGKTPARAYNNMGGQGGQQKTIAMAMAQKSKEIQEQRKKV